jgi:MoxR-like ATPase
MAATARKLKVVDSRVECAICGFKSHSLLDHLTEAHELSAEDYLAAHPGSATLSRDCLNAVATKRKGTRRTSAPDVVNLTADLMGLRDFTVDHGIRELQCLPMPSHWAWPTKGKAKKAYRRALIALIMGQPVYIWGGAGMGKDAIGHAFSALTRTAAELYCFTTGTNVKDWFYTRRLDADGTGWDYGVLWRLLTQGAVGTDGVKRPAMIIFSDIDRGTPEQLEEFRLILDTTSQRIKGPDGSTAMVLPGTRFMFTANSSGTGDESGRMSSQRIDASLIDRMGRFVQFSYLHWDDEGPILRAKFPLVAEVAPLVFDELGKATKRLRDAIDSEELYAEFTHRGICEVLAEATDLIKFNDGAAPSSLLKHGFAAWLDRLDSDQRMIAKRLIDAEITGGTFGDDED